MITVIYAHVTPRKEQERLTEYLSEGLPSCPRHLAEPRHPPTEPTRR